MAADKDSGNEPSLELPSFGFRRKKKARAEAGTPPVSEPEPRDGEPTEVIEPVPAREPLPEPAREPVTEQTDQTELTEVIEPTPAPTPEPTPQPEPTAVPTASAVPPATPPAPPSAVPPATQTAAPPATPAGAAARPSAPAPTTTAPQQTLTEQPTTPAAPRRRARTPAVTLPGLPALSGRVAAVVTGLVVGLAAVALTWTSLQACEVARGTSSCGGGPGLLLLVVVLVLLTFLGGWLLRAFRVDDAGSTSFLAVGLLAVLTMLFLVDAFDSWWSLVLIPPLAAATYALSHWVTTAVAEDS